MAEKTAVFSLKVDTGKSVQDIQAFDKAVENLNADLKDTSKTAQDASTKGMQDFDQKLAELNDRLENGGLTMREMTKLMKEYQNLAAQAGDETPIGAQAIRNAAELKDQIGDLKAQTTALSSDFVGLDTSLQAVETGAAVFQGFQSAVALTGVESEALTETMVKLQAVQGVVNAVSIVANNLNKESILGLQVRNGLEAVKNFIMTGSVAPTLANVAATQAQTAANVGLATATGGATTAMKLFRLALIATGIGGLIVGLIALVSNWEKVKEAIIGVSFEQKALNETYEDYKKGAQEAINKTQQVGNAFDMAREGVISKEEALKIYNDTLGDSFGKTNDINEAERLYNAKAQAFIKSTALKAQAQAIYAKAAEEQVKALTASMEDQTSVLDKAKGALLSYFGFQGQALKSTLDAQKKGEIQAKNDANERAKRFNKLAMDLEKEALLNDKKNKIVVKSDEDKNTRLNAASDKRRERERKKQEEEEKRLKDIAEAERKANEERIRREDEQYQLSIDLMREGLDKELLLLTQSYDKKYEMAHGNAQLEYELRVKEAADRMAIVNKYNQMELDKIAEQEKKKKDLRDKVIRFTNSEQQNELLDLEEWYKAQQEINLAAFKANAIDEEEYYDATLKLDEQFRKKKVDLDKKYADIAKQNEVKAREESIKGVTAAIEGAQKGLDELKKINALINEIDQARLNSISKNREEDLANLDKNLQAQLSQEGLTADQKKKIEENFAQQKYQVQLKAYNEEEKIKKAQFARDKALKLAQIAIDTASAIVKGIAQFGPPPSPAGIAAIASASLIGITQALAVMNQKYQAGSAPTPPQLGGGGGGAAGAAAGEFTANTQAQTTNLNQLGQGQGQGQQTTSKVVVLESDITNTQNKVELQEIKSTF